MPKGKVDIAIRGLRQKALDKWNTAFPWLANKRESWLSAELASKLMGTDDAAEAARLLAAHQSMLSTRGLGANRAKYAGTGTVRKKRGPYKKRNQPNIMNRIETPLPTVGGSFLDRPMNVTLRELILAARELVDQFGKLV
jgi:hypothetical protein